MISRRTALAAAGVALSLVAIWLLLRNVDTASLAREVLSAKPVWLLAGCAVTVLGYYVRAARWGVILAPQIQVPVPRLFAATMVGFLAINTLPARLGEFVRAYVLGRSERVGIGTVLGSVVVERILDLGLLVVFWALSFLFAPYPEWFRWSGYATLGIGVVVAIVLWAIHHAHAGEGRWLARLADRVPERLSSLVAEPLSSFAAGLRVFGRPRTMVRASALSAIMWLVNGVVFLLVGASMDLPLPIWSPFLLAYVVCVAIMVPSAPGFVGVLEGSCVVGLSLIGVEASRALAFGVLYHLTQLLPLIVFGGYYSLRGRMEWSGGPSARERSAEPDRKD